MAHFSHYFIMVSSAFEEARAEAQLLDVAMSHASLIKSCWFVFVRSANVHICFHFNSCPRLDHPSLFNSMFLLHCCRPHTRTSEAISVSAMKLIKIMFPRALHLLGCTYVCFLHASGFNEPGVTVASNSSGALGAEEGTLTKGGLEGLAGVFVGDNLKETSQRENKSKLF